MTRSRIRSSGPIGSVVVLAFLLGLVSAPLRTCLSHQEHDHGAFAYGAEGPVGSGHVGHVGHFAHAEGGLSPGSTPQDEHAANPGCDCLGLCQLESSPALPHGQILVLAVTPVATAPQVLDRDLAPTQGAPHAVPLARGPPALL